MQHQQEIGVNWPKDKTTLKGYKIFKNVNAVITSWILRPEQTTLCLAAVTSDNKPSHIDKAMISLSGTCPSSFNPENYSEGDHIVIELCEPSKTYPTTGMANFVSSPQIPSAQEASAATSVSNFSGEYEPTTKVVITNVPKSLKDGWELHCKQQGVKPWRAFKDLLDEKLLPF